jgi:hypothetical protein
MKTRPVGADLFRVDGQTDMTTLMVAFDNFANVPKAAWYYKNSYESRVTVQEVRNSPAGRIVS